MNEFRGKINLNKEIFKNYIKDNDIYDKTFSNRSNVLYIKNKGLYIKIADKNMLKNEFENTLFFNKLGVAGEVIDYISDEYNDYLIVKEVKGENGISENHMKNPKKLVERFAKHLRMIHSLKYESVENMIKINDLPEGMSRTKALFSECIKNVREDKIDMDDFHNKYKFTPNQGLLMLDCLKDSCVDDVFIHGDYCLPNIIMNDFEFSGIVDMDFSGLGDRHIDIASGLRSLEINFNSKEYDDLFLDSYGRDLIDKDRLMFSKLVLILS